MAGVLANLSTALLRGCQDLLFPPACSGCQAPLPASRMPLFCPPCHHRIKWLDSPLCPGCGRPWPTGAGEDHFCGPCQQKPPHFSRARAALIYQGPIAGAIQACKYQADLAALTSLAALAHRSPAFIRGGAGHAAGPQMTAWSDYDYILPIPLHLQRLRQRGFNQALLLARALFPGQRKKICFDILCRHRWTDPQTGMSGGQRRKNLQNAFAVTAPGKIKKCRLLLVDDVFTTGTTVNECARVLRAAGAAEVAVFTLARVRQ